MQLVLEREPRLKRFFERKEPIQFDQLIKKPFAAVVAAIIGQRISFQEARRIRSALYTLVGSNSSFTSADLDRQTDADLLKTGMSNGCLACLRELSKTDRTTPLTSDSAADLLKVKGVGEWTLVTARLTMDPSLDIFPSADYFIRKRLQREFGLRHLPTVAQTKTMSERWSPYRGLVAWHIWRDF